MDEYKTRGRNSRREDYSSEYDEGNYQERGDANFANLSRMDSIQDPGKRFILKECIGSGVCGDVYEAIDENSGNKKVAIKIRKLVPETQNHIMEEYKVLREFSSHPNLPNFYGIYRKRTGKKSENDQIWFIMELCEGGPVIDLCKGLVLQGKKMREEHIGYIIREVIKALIHLHENKIIHRDVRASNMVLTREGEVKLVDFSFAKIMKGEHENQHVCIGSPSWIAPETVTCKDSGYNTKADVWAIGITAIEMADGKAPFQDMHSTRALFQIVRNPPPSLYRPSNWSQNFNDFINECLEKNPDNRPFMMEILEHPFLSELPENDYTLTQEIKALVMDVCPMGRRNRKPEVIVYEGFLKTHQTEPLEPMLTEDLSALDNLTEDSILNELHERLKLGFFHTFVGDILLILNPNEEQNIYESNYHAKYQCKSRSDNAPHIYSVADSAYQDVLHHEEIQHIIFSGESNSGKTTNMIHLIRHLMYLGKSINDIGARLIKAINIIHAFTNAATPLNHNSTRCLLQIQTTYGSTGKASGAIFWLYQLEKWRISTRERAQSNFHILYYFYDGLNASGKLDDYLLSSSRKYRYLRLGDKSAGNKRSFKVRNDPQGNALKFDSLIKDMQSLELEEHSDTIWKILSAILNLGEIIFVEDNNGEAEIENMETANKVADLLGVEQKKFTWSLVNYCLIKKGAAIRKKHTCDEAKEARDVFANTLYQRLVDWIINIINYKFSISRTLFGDKFCISVLDLFGFECFAVNKIEQLVINTVNEQLQCHYNQQIFAWEMQEQEEEEVPLRKYHYYDNKDALDQLMDKNYGLFHIIDDASRQQQDVQYIFDILNQRSQTVHIKVIGKHEFTVAHYTGKLIYDASDIVEKNRDFLAPEMIETLRLSVFDIIKSLFLNQLTRSGNLTITVEHPNPSTNKTPRSKWGAALMQETTKIRKYNTISRGQFSQTSKMRTCAAVFRSTCLEILKSLSVGGGTHFVRCIRSDLESSPRGFYREVVKQQIRALAILDTAKAKQQGFPYRIPFQEFLRRYKFLAFDFDENVEITKDNCRLLLLRLKMEGWLIGKSKVFLKYYNEEYLSRLYETQVKKIIKVQCMLRAFLARKTMVSKSTKVKRELVKKASIKKKESLEMSQEEAALMIQKAYRGHSVRKEVNPLLKGDMDQETKDFMMFYSQKWRAKSMFQVLLRYRAARYQDLVHFSQQVHLFNQAIVGELQMINERTPLERIDPGIRPSSYLGPLKPPQVYKLPFNIHHELPFFDTAFMNDPTKIKKKAGSLSPSTSDDEHEAWDAPLRRQKVLWANSNIQTRDVQVQTTNSPHRVTHSSNVGVQSLINIPFSRDPNQPVCCPPEETIQNKISTDFQPHVSNNNYKKSFSVQNPHSNIYNSGSIHSKIKTTQSPISYNHTPASQLHSINNNYELNSRSRNNMESDWKQDDIISSNIGNITRQCYEKLTINEHQ
ncbi:neither inactivation nor afterpotential protein C isoform X3 [Leptopilina boulardi]|uniref:neither inactivation nor afterpotential protein C isoform X3 n=1 Tax=Leptopilina boulardi TaxID=63433 RepID=UPI0021F53899|nr:neither inactivation nor afterpotential protein C isoform X3 [Leptopilina boulardi]